MDIELLQYTPLTVADTAIGKCWGKGGMPSVDKMKERMHRVANKNKHASTIEHLVYTFDIDGISRACLQELARHRISSFSVKSSRYTLKELKEASDLGVLLVKTGDTFIDELNIIQLKGVKGALKMGINNDKAKYLLPEAFKTSLVWTVNARSLQNFLELRTNKAALWEIQELAHNIYNTLPTNHRFLFEEYVENGES